MTGEGSRSSGVKSNIRRRKLLAGVSLASTSIFAGCGGIIGGAADAPANQESTSPPDTSSPTPTETPSPTQTATPTPISIGRRNSPNPSQHEVPSPPESDWVVASDGSGDYESVEEVLKITEGGEVLELKSGEYTVTGSGFSALVGAGRDETTINIDKDAFESDFSVHNATLQSNSVIINSLVEFYNCSIGFKIASYQTPSAMIDAINTEFSGTVRASSLDVKGCTFNKIVFRQGDDLQTKAVCEIVDCTIDGSFVGEVVNNGSASRCEFNERAMVDGLNATDSLFSSGVKGGNNISNCRAESGVSFSDSSGPYAVIGGKNLEYSEVEGKIGEKINNIYGCIFNNVTEGRWNQSDKIINYADTGDKIANNIEYSAFLDGKLVINKTEAGTETPSVDHNYYSTYDESDEDGDGIMDKPYPVPGSADVVDRNPLKNEDIVSYLESIDSS